MEFHAEAMLHLVSCASAPSSNMTTNFKYARGSWLHTSRSEAWPADTFLAT
jgi:hypothetical protein